MYQLLGASLARAKYAEKDSCVYNFLCTFTRRTKINGSSHLGLHSVNCSQLREKRRSNYVEHQKPSIIEAHMLFPQYSDGRKSHTNESIEIP